MLPFIGAHSVAKKILKNNRPGKVGSGFGTKAANLFIDLWQSEKEYNDTIVQCIATPSQTIKQTSLIGEIATKHLKPLKLVEIVEDSKTRKRKVQAIRNFRNRVVYWLVNSRINS